ncbi:hypothetical protein HMPREF1624_07664 [Sporothrix schenckii ATCC 58251]|uniref:Zn(2)-C6 fungal-type domain-containing protein n=1 Tax=Sporothrix schenckii (strain ATCC 58251 / de Perez 2211183) TaxID=1391915 RepID=U7PKE9_SPOS1|nr:hypothetical protein HMPREF1624_07664 [Sporothrix schenckii ATCC 58251]
MAASANTVLSKGAPLPPSSQQQQQQPPAQDNSPAASSTSATTTAAGPTTSVPAPKRQRVSRACDQCRAMREKCDGAQPQCSSCVTQRRACTYNTSPKKRGVQTGYIRTLELTLSSLLDEVPGCADALDGLFGRHGGDAAQRLFNPEAGAAGSQQQQQKDLERHNRLHRRWHKSRARREINRLLSTDGFSTAVARPVSDDRAGSDDDTFPEGPGRAPDTLSGEPAASAITWSPSENTIPSPRSGTGGHTDDARCNSRVPLPPNHWQLLDVYFSYTHCWFPILERQDLLKAVYQYERELGEPASAPTASGTPSSPSAATAELWSVLALASFQNAASRSQQQADPNTTTSTATSTATPSTTHCDPSLAWPPHRIYNVARQMIPLDDGPFEIPHARALLLLALINIGRRRHTAARVLVALSRQILQDADCLSRVSENSPMAIRRRIVDAVTSGCCIIEAFLAIVRSSLRPLRSLPQNHNHQHQHQQQAYRSHQNPGSFSPHSPHNCPALPEDGLDEWQPWVPCAGFGLEDGGATSERSPAYALTTFNQLHDLFTCMQHQQTNLSQAPSPSDYNDVVVATAAGTNDNPYGDALDRVIRPDVPFSAFVRSTDRASAAVPSAHILRITFIWMHILLPPFSEPGNVNGSINPNRAHLLADVLEQFVARFGSAGAPPTLVPCILTVVEHPLFQQLPPLLQQRFCALRDALVAVWQDTATSQQQSQKQLPAVANATTPWPNAMLRQKLAPSGQGIPGAAMTTANNAPVVYQSASPEAAAVRPQHQQQQQPPTARHHRLSFLETSLQAVQPTQQQQPQPQDANMYNGNGPSPAFGFPPLPIASPTAATAATAAVAANAANTAATYPMTGSSYGAVGGPGNMAVDNFDGAFHGAPGASGGTLDYEALLDDLSAVDYLDRLDADIGSQFMANLGFAPGIDNNLGAMMGEFGGL